MSKSQVSETLRRSLNSANNQNRAISYKMKSQINDNFDDETDIRPFTVSHAENSLAIEGLQTGPRSNTANEILSPLLKRNTNKTIKMSTVNKSAIINPQYRIDGSEDGSDEDDDFNEGLDNGFPYNETDSTIGELAGESAFSFRKMKSAVRSANPLHISSATALSDSISKRFKHDSFESAMDAHNVIDNSVDMKNKHDIMSSDNSVSLFNGNRSVASDNDHISLTKTIERLNSFRQLNPYPPPLIPITIGKNIDLSKRSVATNAIGLKASSPRKSKLSGHKGLNRIKKSKVNNIDTSKDDITSEDKVHQDASDHASVNTYNDSVLRYDHSDNASGLIRKRDSSESLNSLFIDGERTGSRGSSNSPNGSKQSNKFVTVPSNVVTELITQNDNVEATADVNKGLFESIASLNDSFDSSISMPVSLAESEKPAVKLNAISIMGTPKSFTLNEYRQIKQQQQERNDMELQSVLSKSDSSINDSKSVILPALINAPVPSANNLNITLNSDLEEFKLMREDDDLLRYMLQTNTLNKPFNLSPININFSDKFSRAAPNTADLILPSINSKSKRRLNNIDYSSQSLSLSGSNKAISQAIPRRRANTAAIDKHKKEKFFSQTMNNLDKKSNTVMTDGDVTPMISRRPSPAEIYRNKTFEGGSKLSMESDQL